MSATMDDENVQETDLYGCLGIFKEASTEEINNAFRRLSRMYHPDKHIEPDRKQKAVLMFNKIKYAHEILMDPYKRAIYDTLGLKALETESWEIVARRQTPQEIREEYERLLIEREERRLNQRTNPKGSITVGIDATDLFDRYVDQYSGATAAAGSELPTIEVSSMSISQSIDCPLTNQDTAILGGNLSTHNGTGSGTITASSRRILSDKGWAELEVSAGNGPMIHLKGFRTFTKHLFGTMSGFLQFSRGGIQPGVSTMFAAQLDKSLQGRISINLGLMTSITTTVVHDYKDNHLVFGIQLGIPNSFVTAGYTRRFPQQEAKIKLALKFGTFGGIVEYGAEKKVSQFSVLGAHVVIGVPTGVLLKIKLHRGNQTYNFPIHLSESMNPTAIFYGTLVPLVAFIVVKNLLIKPFLEQQRERDLEKKRQTNSEMMAEKKREAEAARDLMKESVIRIREFEEGRKGLVIVKAVFGKLISTETNDIDESVCVDVTDPIQSLVKNSQLIIPGDQLKSGLPGFYDPCIGEDKVLYIRYRFRQQLHHVTVGEIEELRCPLQRHLITSES
ncbi:dnaJ homolog subfamily C member 11-like [Tubulanus polymorphus]|uniref:dnaJ homolog subfamily C member 11-like n=1 Tax=Tubulanus polymorphus TaxID=672921 RepID=UPI003DA650CA